MPLFADYLLKSAVWLSAFTLVWILFLRNERFFTLKIIFLLFGTVASLFLPLLAISYKVEITLPAQLPVIPLDQPLLSGPATPADSGSLFPALFIAYLVGAVLLLIRTLAQSAYLFFSNVHKVEYQEGRARVILSRSVSPSLTFFNYIFLNPSLPENEKREILNHELAHVSQKHWADLILVHLLYIVQWANPLAWLWARFVKQNHEYLADRAALELSSDPAIYRSVLLNQMLGSRVFALSSSFNQSASKKRFEMMKNLITSPLRKLRFLAIIPVMALIMYAFAEPAYIYVSVPENSQNDTTLKQSTEMIVRGRVMGTDGPLDGAIVIVTGTNTGTVTDSDGFYTIAIPGGTRTTLNFPAKDSGMNSIAVSNSGKSTLTITYSAKGYRKTLVERDIIPPGTADPDLMVIDITLEKEPDTEAQLTGTDTTDIIGISRVQEHGINGLPGTETTDTLGISPMKEEGIDELPESDTRDTGRTGAPGDAESILYIIDGKIAEIFSAYMLNVTDIKSVSVIKSPEAIKTHSKLYNYSVEGITSVILIETKKGD